MLQTASTLPIAPRRADGSRQFIAALMALMVTAPLLLMPLARPQAAQAQIPNPLKNMSTGKKVVLVAGAALLYYLYKKHQAKVAAEQVSTPTATTTAPAANRKPQLYRSKNGGIYYRDANGKAVWLTVPNQRVQVSQAELNQYAPDYQKYQNMPAPPAPSGYRTQTFRDFDPALMNGAGGGSAPGPRGRM